MRHYLDSSTDVEKLAKTVPKPYWEKGYLKMRVVKDLQALAAPIALPGFLRRCGKSRQDRPRAILGKRLFEKASSEDLALREISLCWSQLF